MPLREDGGGTRNCHACPCQPIPTSCLSRSWRLPMSQILFQNGALFEIALILASAVPIPRCWPG
jgi:hypothetical protein